MWVKAIKVLAIFIYLLFHNYVPSIVGANKTMNKNG